MVPVSSFTTRLDLCYSGWMKKATAQPDGKPQPFVVTASHNMVLQGVHQYQLLSSLQLVKVCGYSANSLHRVQTIVKELTDNEYLLSLARPVTRGKSPLVYTLARKGLNYLKGNGFDVREYFRPSKEQEKSYLFLLHTLAVNDVLIAAANLHKFVSDYSLLSFTHERVLKQTPYKLSFMRGGKLETVTLIPDAYLLFVKLKKIGIVKDIPRLLELDRNTTEQKHFRRNLRARIEFIKEEGYKKLLGTNTVSFAYAVAAGGEKRLDELLSWARKEFASTNEQKWLSNMFLFTALPAEINPKELFSARVWFTPFDNKVQPQGLFEEQDLTKSREK